MDKSDCAIMSLLKERTKSLHQETEAEVKLFDRLRSLSSYAQLLSRFYGFYRSLEEQFAQVAGLEAAVPDLRERQKARLILLDLAVCGWTAAQIAEIPPCPALPNVAGVPSALGCMYVLEGATLGAQFIRREVESRLGLTPGSGCTFFNGYGSDRTRPMWQAFSNNVDEWQQTHPTHDEEIISAASDTFTRFKEWMACRLN